MAGIIHKIEETLGMGGTDHKKEAEKHKVEEKKHDQGHSGEKKEGMMEKIKDKISGDKSGEGEHGNKEEKKKKKKKEKKHGDDHSGGDSSSSDSD